MKIQVTEEHIKNGIKHSCRRCPVAQAIKLHIKENFNVHVIGVAVKLYLVNNVERYTLPDEIIEWIKQFDAGLSVKPVSFELEIDSKFLKGQ